MAYAAYRESFGATVFSVTAEAAPTWLVLDVTVHSCDALLVRHTLANCAGAFILRCVPRLEEHWVRLEIRLPADSVEEVIHRIMVCVPAGEVGHLSSWQCYLQQSGQIH